MELTKEGDAGLHLLLSIYKYMCGIKQAGLPEVFLEGVFLRELESVLAKLHAVAFLIVDGFHHQVFLQTDGVDGGQGCYILFHFFLYFLGAGINFFRT